MMRQAGSRYETGRSATLLKVKSFHDAEARVLKHLEGSGRHKGRLGALFVELADGTTFSVGTGFSDKEHEQPRPVGSLITFRHQELSEGGVPRFPSFVGVRDDAEDSPAPKKNPSPPKRESPAAKKGTEPMSTRTTGSTRRFEFSEGKSNNWEITVAGTDVTVRFGRIGTTGQAQAKSFADAAKAAKHADKLVEEKTQKAYTEVG